MPHDARHVLSECQDLLTRLASGQTRASQVLLRGAPAHPSNLTFITISNVIEQMYGWRKGRCMVGDFLTHIYLHHNLHCEGYMYGWRNVVYRRERGTLLLNPPATPRKLGEAGRGRVPKSVPSKPVHHPRTLYTLSARTAQGGIMMDRKHALFLLSLNVDYDQAALNSAYRHACLRFHYEKCAGESEKFHEASKAYELLKGGASDEGAILEEGV